MCASVSAADLRPNPGRGTSFAVDSARRRIPRFPGGEHRNAPLVPRHQQHLDAPVAAKLFVAERTGLDPVRSYAGLDERVAHGIRAPVAKTNVAGITAAAV